MTYKIIELTQGNINNNHLYLSSIIDFFPPSSVGGGNETEVASQLLEIHCGIESPVFTDIAGDKKIFRKRAWVKEFFQSHALSIGNKVVIEKTDAYRYHIYPARV